MPAISAPDPLVLPRVPEVDATAIDRPVVSVTTAVPGLEGEGFPVRRAFAGVPQLLGAPLDEAVGGGNGRAY